MEFEGARVIVTGATGGVGGAIAAEFARNGAQIIAIDRVCLSDPAHIEMFTSPTGQAPLQITADVGNSDEVRAAFDELLDEGGAADVLVNAAGIREIAASVNLPVEAWREVVDTNLNGTFYCSQCAGKGAIADGGTIINISSVAGLTGIGNRPAYTATKHAIVGLTRCLAREFAERRIRVNAVCPGIIRTPMTEAYFADERFLAELPIFIPLGHVGDPADVASAVSFLASSQARYITGVALPVDGGWSAEKSFALPSESTAYLATVLPG